MASYRVSNDSSQIVAKSSAGRIVDERRKAAGEAEHDDLADVLRIAELQAAGTTVPEHERTIVSVELSPGIGIGRVPDADEKRRMSRAGGHCGGPEVAAIDSA